MTVWPILAAICAVGIAVIVQFTRLDTRVDNIAEHQKDLLQKIEQLQVEAARGSAKADGVESRLQRVEAREDAQNGSTRTQGTPKR